MTGQQWHAELREFAEERYRIYDYWARNPPEDWPRGTGVRSPRSQAAWEAYCEVLDELTMARDIAAREFSFSLAR